MIFNLEEKQITKESGGIINIKRHDLSRQNIFVFWSGHKQLIFAIFFSALLHYISIFLMFETSDIAKKDTNTILDVQPLEVQMHANLPAATLAPSKFDTVMPAIPNQRIPQHELEKKPYAKMSAEKEVGAVFSEPVFAVEITPRYPLPLLAKGTKGSVSAIFEVERSGAIIDIEITDSQPPGVFDSAAIAAISSARMKEGSVRQGQRLGVTIVFDPMGVQATQQFPRSK